MSIISPFWFYLIDVLGNLKDVSKIIVICTIGLGSILAVVLFVDGWDDNNFVIKKALKITLIILCIATSSNIFIPSEKTMYTMMVANVVTYENVDKAADVISDSVDYVMDKLGIEDDSDEQKDDVKDKGEETNEDKE